MIGKLLISIRIQIDSNEDVSKFVPQKWQNQITRMCNCWLRRKWKFKNIIFLESFRYELDFDINQMLNYHKFNKKLIYS